ncbi:MAG: hypothetical protein PHR94_17000 [Methylomonas lenta]|nr:hypothetical protein [Methylomonas lenta]
MLKGVIDQWKLYVGAIYQQTYDGKDADFIRYSAGLSYHFNSLAEAIGFAETKLSVQWSGDETLDYEDVNKIGYSSRKARLFRNTVLVKPYSNKTTNGVITPWVYAM